MRVGENFCPGILHAVPAKDGLLLRIRVPGGLLTARQLAAVAALSAAHANGELELTSRSNLQLRGILSASLPCLADTLRDAGLLPSAEHDRVRNIVASPFAGMDPAEWLDTRPLVRALDERLMMSEPLQQLHPKFTFGLHGGPERYTQEVEDVSLQAGEGGDRLHLLFAGVSSGFSVAQEDAVPCLLKAAETCLRLARQYGVSARAKTLLARPELMAAIYETLSLFLEASAGTASAPRVEKDPVGTYPAREAGRVNLVPSVPLGQISAYQAGRLAALAEEHQADLRLAPWRGLVLGDVTAASALTIAPELAALALPLDGSSGYRGLAACAGSLRCDAAVADVRGDAAELARRLAKRPSLAGWSVHLSGCEKQCALRHEASAALVADPSGYTLKVQGQTVASSLRSEAALASVLQAHSEACA